MQHIGSHAPLDPAHAGRAILPWGPLWGRPLAGPATAAGRGAADGSSSSAPRARNVLRSQEKLSAGAGDSTAGVDRTSPHRAFARRQNHALTRRQNHALTRRQNTTQLVVVVGHFWLSRECRSSPFRAHPFPTIKTRSKWAHVDRLPWPASKRTTGRCSKPTRK
jgi:hypothetical protein